MEQRKRCGRTQQKTEDNAANTRRNHVQKLIGTGSGKKGDMESIREELQGNPQNSSGKHRQKGTLLKLRKDKVEVN